MVICPSLERTDDILQINDLCLWSDLYLQNCIDKLYKECTVEHYRTALKRFGIWHSDRLKEGVLTKRKAGDFAFWLGNVKRRFDDHPDKPTEDSNLSPATVRRTIGVVRTFLPGCMMKVICHGISQVGFRFHQFVKSRRR